MQHQDDAVASDVRGDEIISSGVVKRREGGLQKFGRVARHVKFTS